MTKSSRVPDWRAAIRRTRGLRRELRALASRFDNSRVGKGAIYRFQAKVSACTEEADRSKPLRLHLRELVGGAKSEASADVVRLGLGKRANPKVVSRYVRACRYARRRGWSPLRFELELWRQGGVEALARKWASAQRREPKGPSR